ncbi:ABC transporter permease [Streptomyces odontomachi]|uniref:ABC transporter permease n=1 Tax=Streptomyces odontomachi TaxID=2944940 RepID=UPI00210DFFA6|nr:FtsX-like permease family protein [Streptomyces sp. ODS25]
MFRLALATLRKRKGSAVGSLLALFCAAAIVCACGVLLESGIHGKVPVERYAGTSVMVGAKQEISWTKVKHKKGKTKKKTKSDPLSAHAWLPTSVGDRLSALPGAKVVEDLTFTANLVSPSGSVLPGPEGKPSKGHGWASAALTPYTLVSGTEPRRDDDVVIDTDLAAASGLKAGDRTVIQSTGSPQTFRVAGVVQPKSAVNHESALFFDAKEARTLAGHAGKVAAYGVSGVSPAKVEAALSGTTAQVFADDDRGKIEYPDASAARTKLISMSGAIGGTALIVAVLVVVGTFALSIQQRYRELAMLRAIGAKPRQIRRMIGREALLLGVVAAIPGALVGLPLSSFIHHEFVSLGALPDALKMTRGPLPVLGGAFATVLAAWVAARVTGRRIARISPMGALAESAVERRSVGAGRVLAGLVFTGVAVIITVVLAALHTEAASMPVTYLSILLWMIAVSLLGPYLSRAAVALLRGPLRAFPVGGFLASRNSHANSRRFSSVVTPLALLIGMTTTILFVPSTISQAAQAQSDAGIKADHVVTADGPGVPAAAARELSAAPGVSTVTQLLQTRVWVGQDKRQSLGVSSAGLQKTLDPDVKSGSLAHFGHGTIAMSEGAADGRDIGDRVQLTLGDGTKASFRLVATYGRSLGFGDILFDFDDVDGHVDNPLASALLVKDTSTADRLGTRLKRFPGLAVASGSAFDQLQADQEKTNNDANMMFMGLIIAFTAIAIINTLAMATGGRSREIALMRLVGSTRRQVLRTLRWEVALMLVVATVLGTGAAWLTLSGFSVGMVGSASPGIVPGSYLLVLVGAIALGMVGTVVPARFVMRRNPAEDINGRQ